MRAELRAFFDGLLADSTYTHADWGERHLTAPSWRGFEELVALLWQDMGYETELVAAKRDGGIDVIAENASRIPLSVAPSITIQVKQWSNKVPVSKVRDLHGVQYGGHTPYDIERFDESILVTAAGCDAESSGFTRDARQFAAQNGIGLVDGEVLLELLDESNLSPLRLGRKSGRKWHFREPPRCGWAKTFSRNQSYNATVQQVYNADRRIHRNICRRHARGTL